MNTTALDFNEKFDLTASLILYTNQSIFLTGKAGTGKTTFLKYIKEKCKKNMVVVAPTGVAAINAGGMTMHSFFQLPLQSYVPQGGLDIEQHPHIVTPNTLFSKLRINETKRNLMRDLDLLIIDEISMVSADMLDCTDIILRTMRKRYNEPFGGVQVLFIGDLYQLPPVIREGNWNILQEYYESPYFFESHAVKKSNLVYIELDKIYRQTDALFINLLNNIRHNQVSRQELNLLNDKYQPDFEPSIDEGYITLTTHNAKADKINQQYLNNLRAKEFSFKAIIDGDFNEKALPTEQDLILKTGAQIMFVRNDTSEDKRYYNGKIGWVKSIDKVDGENEITIRFNGEPDLVLNKCVWENTRYKYEKEKGTVSQETIGKFTQYPVRLAWAITIHKSQGLTFEKALIDAGDSFSAGQVYVALSRCTTLEGIILKSKINQNAIISDHRINLDNRFTKDLSHLKTLLEIEKDLFLKAQFKKVFDLSKLVHYTEQWSESIMEKKLPNVPRDYAMSRDVVSKSQELEKVVFKFNAQLDKIFELLHQHADWSSLKERVEKAIPYFTERIGEDILMPIQMHLHQLKLASKVKIYKREVELLYGAWVSKLEEINFVKYHDHGFEYDSVMLKKYLTNYYIDDEKKTKGTFKVKTIKGSKPEKGETFKLTYELLQEGKKIEDIATIRNLAKGTIESHIATLVGEGKLDIYQYFDRKNIDQIKEVLEDKNNSIKGQTGIKSLLPDYISYAEIKAVFKLMEFENANMVD